MRTPKHYRPHTSRNRRMANLAEVLSCLRRRIERYARHIVLREVGGPGQAKLGPRARAGGRRRRPRRAGAVLSRRGRRRDARRDRRRHRVAVEPAAAGDPRHAESAVPKVESAARAIARLNPHVPVGRMRAADRRETRWPDSQYDIVADGSDNFATRYLVSDACYFANKPLVTAAVGTFDGTLTTIRPHERGNDGKPNPTYRACFRSRRRPAPCRPARRPASSAR